MIENLPCLISVDIKNKIKCRNLVVRFVVNLLRAHHGLGKMAQ